MVERSLSMREVTGSTPVSSKSFSFSFMPFMPLGKQHQLIMQGVVAQWTTRLTTDQKIPGSTPGSLEFFNKFSSFFEHLEW